MKNPKAIAFTLLAGTLVAVGSWYFFIYRPAHPKGPKPPPPDPNANTGLGGGNSTAPAPPAAVPFSNFKVGDKVFAFVDSCTYDKDPAAGGKCIKLFRIGSYMGTVATKGTTGMTLRNYSPDLGSWAGQYMYAPGFDGRYYKG